VLTSRGLAVSLAISSLICLLLASGCAQSSTGSIGLRTASMVTPTDDGRLPAESAWYMRFDPP
jgi:hypothetical protein